MLQLSIPQCLLLLTKDRIMTNPNRGPRGRFSSRRVNNDSSPLKQTDKPSSSFARPEPTVKKRRLNDSTAQFSPPSRPSSPQPTTQSEPPRPRHPQSYELKQLVNDQKNYPLTHGNELNQAATATNKAPSADEKRTLRSQDVARPRSELANFFADYDEIVFDETDSQG